MSTEPILVSDRLPEEGQQCLFWNRIEDEWVLCRYTYDKKYGPCVRLRDWEGMPTTETIDAGYVAWIPLPPAPPGPPSPWAWKKGSETHELSEDVVVASPKLHHMFVASRVDNKLTYADMASPPTGAETVSDRVIAFAASQIPEGAELISMGVDISDGTMSWVATATKPDGTIHTMALGKIPMEELR